MLRSHVMRIVLVVVGLFAVVGCHDYTFDPHENPGEIGIYDDLFSVSVVDEKEIFSSGYFGTIYHSPDGGMTWTQQTTNTMLSIYDISMADAKNGWAVGQIGMILHTTDGGQTWTPQPNVKAEQQTNLFAVQALDVNTAWAVGEWGSIIVTQNAGKTWQDRSLTIGLNDPSFQWLRPDDQEKIRNGGNVFRDVGLNDIYCRPLPSASCWIVGEYGKIFNSHDGGASWEAGEILGTTTLPPLAFEVEGTTVQEEARAQLGVLVQEIIDRPHLKIEINPYVTQAEIDSLLDLEDPTELFELIEERAGEANSTLIDEGMFSDRIFTEGEPPWDWEDFIDDDPDFLNRYLVARMRANPEVGVTVLHRPYLFHIRFDSDKNGVVAGLGGILLGSDDGGRTWSYRDSQSREALFAADYSANRLIAVGEKGLARFSDKGGQSWGKPRGGFPKLFTYFRDVSFEPLGRVGFIVGQKGTILRSEDSGNSWTQVLPAK